MNTKVCIVLFSLLVTSTCHSFRLLVDEDELTNEVNERVNKEIGFDETLKNYNLTSFRQLLIKAKLFDRLNVTSTSYTVFAPTNEAIVNAKSVLANATRLPEILMYHVHLGSFPTNKIKENMKLKTLLGGQQKIRFERYKGVVYASCKPFGKLKDHTYDNGMLDIMNGVMVPPEGTISEILAATSTFSSYLGYAKTARFEALLNDPSQELTLLVPNDAAFEKLPSDVKEKMQESHQFLLDVLEYHVIDAITCLDGFENGSVESYEGQDITVAVSGKKVMFNTNSSLIQADIIAYNGVLQVIDTVLLPPSHG